MPQRLMMHQTQEPASILKERPEVSPDLVAICAKMMAKSPGRRYQTAADVSAVLTRWLELRGRASDGPLGSGSGSGSGISSLRLAAAAARASGQKQGIGEASSSDDNEDLGLAPLDDEPKSPSGIGTPSIATPAIGRLPGVAASAAAPAANPPRIAPPAGAGIKPPSGVGVKPGSAAGIKASSAAGVKPGAV